MVLKNIIYLASGNPKYLGLPLYTTNTTSCFKYTTNKHKITQPLTNYHESTYLTSTIKNALTQTW